MLKELLKRFQSSLLVASQIQQKDLHIEFLQEKLQLYPLRELALKQVQPTINLWKISKKWLHTLTKSIRQISKGKSLLEKEQEVKLARRQC